MKIIKHKSLNLDVQTALSYFRKEKALPPDMAMNVTGDSIIFEPIDCCNIFGQIDDRY